jgi:hypothetical protein
MNTGFKPPWMNKENDKEEEPAGKAGVKISSHPEDVDERLKNSQYSVTIRFPRVCLFLCRFPFSCVAAV